MLQFVEQFLNDSKLMILSVVFVWIGHELADFAVVLYNLNYLISILSYLHLSLLKIDGIYKRLNKLCNPWELNRLNVMLLYSITVTS